MTMRRHGGHDPEARWALWIVVGTPLLFAAVSLQMMLELVAANPVYGVRTAATFASEEALYRANRASGIAGVAAGIIGFAANVLVARSKVAPRRKITICLGILLPVTVVMVLPGLLAA